MSAVPVRRLLLTGLAVSVVGCADSSSAPSTAPPLDLSAVLAQLSIATSFTVAGAGAAATSPLNLSIQLPNPSSCSYSPAKQGFTCATLAANGITLDLTYYLFDAAGHALVSSQGDGAASVRAVTDTKGTASIQSNGGAAGAVALDDHSDMTLSGLQSDKRTLSGNTTSVHDVQLTGANAYHAVVQGTSVTHDVVLPRATAAPSWPLSGTIVSDFTTAVNHPSPAVTSSTHSVLTFNGTSIVTMVMTTTTSAGAGTTTCTIDLSGAKAPACT